MTTTFWSTLSAIKKHLKVKVKSDHRSKFSNLSNMNYSNMNYFIYFTSKKHLFISKNCLGIGKCFADRNFTQRPYRYSLNRRCNLTRLVMSAKKTLLTIKQTTKLLTSLLMSLLTSLLTTKQILVLGPQQTLRINGNTLWMLMNDKIIIPIMDEFCFLNFLRSQREISAPAPVILFLSIAMEANWSMVL